MKAMELIAELTKMDLNKEVYFRDAFGVYFLVDAIETDSDGDITLIEL